MSAQIAKVLLDLDAGVFEQKINHFLGEVAAAVVTHQKTGQIQITFDMKEIPNSGQIMLKHTLKYKMPTANGSIVEDNTSSCPMHVGRGGSISIFPENQKDLFKAEGNL